MREVGILEAKTELSSLIAEVESTGEEIVLTRRGRPAARIVPITTRPVRTLEQRRKIARQVLTARDARSTVPGFDDLSWDELKVLARDEDRYD
jgi:prevent-host-death family protein